MTKAPFGVRMTAPFYPGLDLLRIGAALYLVMFHLSPAGWPPLIGRFFSHGPAATGMFFILSGYLLTLLHLNLPMQRTDQSRFVWRRLSRIWPVHILGLGCIVLWQLHFGFMPDFNTILTCALMIQTWKVGSAHLLNTPAWSISCLLFFYLLFPVLLPVIRRFSLRTVSLIALPLWLLACLLPLWLVNHPGVYAPGDWAAYLHNSPLLRLPAFLLGMLAAVAVRRMGPLPSWLFPVAVTGVVLVLLLAPTEHFAVNNELFAPLALLLVVACTNPPSLVTQLGRLPLTRRLASASIAVFLLHSFWIQLFGHELAVRHLGWNPLAFALFMLAVWGSALLVDAALLPCTRWLRRPSLPRLPVPVRHGLSVTSGDD